MLWKQYENKYLVLFAINLTEPTRLEDLAHDLVARLSKEELDASIEQLVTERRVVKESGYFRLTYIGTNSVGKKRSSYVRDLRRMFYLHHHNQQGEHEL